MKMKSLRGRRMLQLSGLLCLAAGRHQHLRKMPRAAPVSSKWRLGMESFRDYDRETWLASHDDRAVTVFASGTRRIGIDAIGDGIAFRQR